MEIILAILIGYVLGSLPFALIIGKVFYNTDVRLHGSGNLGGSNTGRVLGKKAGITVMVLDVAKVVVAFTITSLLKYQLSSIILAGCFATIGHCYPLFANFKGGKAVSTLYGFLFGCMIYVFHDPLVFFLPLGVFLLTLYITKIVAISSIISSVVSSIYIWMINDNMLINLAAIAIALLLTYRHKANIKRMIDGNENKITWM